MLISWSSIGIKFKMVDQKWTGTAADRSEMKTLKLEQVLKVSCTNLKGICAGSLNAV